MKTPESGFEAMRWVWPILAFAVLGAVWLPLGNKQVYDFACHGEWGEGESCTNTVYDLDYYLLRMEGTVQQWFGRGEATDAPVHAEYGLMQAPNQEFMFGGLPILYAFLFLGLVAVPVAGTHHVIQPTPRNRIIALAAWGIFTIGIAGILATIAFHSFMWRGEDVEPFVPGWGILGLLLAPLSGYPLMPAKESEAMPSLPPAN